MVRINIFRGKECIDVFRCGYIIKGVMANIVESYYYGISTVEYTKGVQGVSMQLHLTAKCDQRCKHCYMYNSPYFERQIKEPMSKQTLFSLVDEYYSFMNEYDCEGAIALTGGDPILSPYFWGLLEHINQKYKGKALLSVLGNSYHVNRDVARRMKELGVSQYQISIDGMRETHDYFRKFGSFDDALRALKVLFEEGIKTLVSFTLSKKNAQELLPLYDYLNELEFVYAFGFNRMIPTGNGENMVDDIFSPYEFKEFLFNVLKHEMLGNKRLVLSKEEEMWKLLLYELGLIDPIDTSKKKHFITGCKCGTQTFSVLADGTFLPCRKLELDGGKYPEKSLKELFVNNDITQMFRNHNLFKGCSECDVNFICRGCPAMKYAVTKDFYGYEPYCWRCK